MYFFRYHDLDDEPTCAPFTADLESIAMDRAVLKAHILKEIQDYHKKKPRPKEFLKPFLIPANPKSKNIVVVQENQETGKKDGRE